jgi:hypothetical protein
MTIDLELNGAPASLDCEPQKPLLRVLREDSLLISAVMPARSLTPREFANLEDAEGVV